MDAIIICATNRQLYICGVVDNQCSFTLDKAVDPANSVNDNTNFIRKSDIAVSRVSQIAYGI